MGRTRNVTNLLWVVTSAVSILAGTVVRKGEASSDYSVLAGRMLWDQAFEGRLESIAVAGKTGDVAVAVLDRPGEGSVCLISSEGRILWQRRSTRVTDIEKVGEIRLAVSDDGQRVYVCWSGDLESLQEQVYDRDGRTIFDVVEGMGGWTSLLPSGRLVRTDGVFDTSGQRLSLVSPSPGLHVSYSPLSDSEVVVTETEDVNITSQQYSEYLKGHGRLPSSKPSWRIASIPDGRTKLVPATEAGLKAAPHDIRRVGDFMLVSTFATEPDGLMMCYDNAGKLLWSSPPNTGFYRWDQLTLVEVGGRRLLGVLGNSRLRLLDLRSGQPLASENLRLGRIYSFLSRTLGEKCMVFVSQARPRSSPGDDTQHRFETSAFSVTEKGELRFEGTEEGTLVVGSQDSRFHCTCKWTTDGFHLSCSEREER